MFRRVFLLRTIEKNLSEHFRRSPEQGKALNFKLPDLRNRFPIQSANGEDAVGVLGGKASVTITAANLPQHTHVVTDPGHTHNGSVPPHTHTFQLPAHDHVIAPAIEASAAPSSANPPYTGALLDNGNSFSPPSTSTSMVALASWQTSGFVTTPAPAQGLTDPNTATSGATTSKAVTGITIAEGGGVITPTAVSIMPPTLTINFIICVSGGEYPTRPN